MDEIELATSKNTDAIMIKTWSLSPDPCRSDILYKSLFSKYECMYNPPESFINKLNIAKIKLIKMIEHK